MTVLKVYTPGVGWEPILVGEQGPAGPTGATGATGPQGPAGIGSGGAGLPTGGATGTQLVKASTANGDSVWQTKPVFDVRDYGAVGNGVANNLTAVQAAIDAAAAAGGGVVHFPKGDWLINGTTRPRITTDNISLTGAGVGTARIICSDIETSTAGTSREIFIVGQGGGAEISNVRVAGIEFAFTAANTYRGVSTCLRASRVHNLVIENCSFRYGTYGVYINRAHGFVVANNEIDGTRADGIHMENGTDSTAGMTIRDGRVYGNHIHDTNDDCIGISSRQDGGVYRSRPTNVSIYGNLLGPVFTNGGGIGIYGIDGCKVFGNRIVNPRSHFINVLGSRDSTMDLYPSTNVDITNNDCYSNQAAAGGGPLGPVCMWIAGRNSALSGAEMNEPFVQNVRVANNRFVVNDRCGIWIQPRNTVEATPTMWPDGLIIEDNEFIFTGTAPALDYRGFYSIYTNNLTLRRNTWRGFPARGVIIDAFTNLTFVGNEVTDCNANATYANVDMVQIGLGARASDTLVDISDNLFRKASGTVTRLLYLRGDGTGSNYSYQNNRLFPFGATVTTAVSTLYARPAGVPFSVSDYGAKGDGTTNDAAAFQVACDAVSSGQTLRTTPGATYLLNTEIQLRKDGAIYDFTGSTFIGPVGGVVNGGLITVGDRVTPAHIVSNVTVFGGHFRPQNVIDNGINVLCATRCRLYNQSADLTVGQRGVALQATTAFGGGATAIKDIIIDGFFSYGGGVNGINIDTTGGNLVSQVTMHDVVVLGATVGVRVSAGTDAFRADRVVLDNATLVGCATGVTWFRTTDSRMSNVDILATTTRGIDGRLAETNAWNNIRVSCTSGDGIAVTLGDENTFSDLSVKGGSFGILLNSTDTVVNGLTLINCTTGLSTVDLMRTTWNDVTFENCATPVNAWRDCDRYTNFALRDATASYTLPRPARVITADRTLDITDAGRVIEVNSASAVSVTFPLNATAPMPVGTELIVYRHGAGTVTPVATGGVTIRNLAAVSAQYGTIRFRKRGTDEWIQS